MNKLNSWKKIVVHYKHLLFVTFSNVLMSWWYLPGGICERIRFILYLFPFWCQVFDGIRWFFKFQIWQSTEWHVSLYLMIPCKANGVHICHFTAVLVPTFFFKLCFTLIFPCAMAIPQLQSAMGKVNEYCRMETVQFCFCWTGEVSQMNSINSDFPIMYLTAFVGWVLLKCEMLLYVTGHVTFSHTLI